MSRQFVAGIDEVSDEQKKLLRERFSREGSWWNWIPYFWLITTNDDTTADVVRDRICKTAPGVNCMVVQIDEGGWAGYGPTTKKRDMFRWVHNTWGKAGE
jgi:hypothetical protein